MRLRTVAAITLVGVAAAAAAGWYLWLPNWRPPLLDGEAYGVDVSHHQGEIDWSAVAADGISFAYIKASEGEDFTDDRFAENWAQARDAGVEVGAYHYFTLCTEGAAQARHFLRVAPPDAAALPPALDLEFGGNCSARPTTADLRREVDAFLRIVEDAWGREVVLYVFHSFERAHQVRATYDRPLWTPSYPRRPRDDWSVWQLHGFARVNGVQGPVDLDVARLTDLR
jgi:lysozyme